MRSGVRLRGCETACGETACSWPSSPPPIIGGPLHSDNRSATLAAPRLEILTYTSAQDVRPERLQEERPLLYPVRRIFPADEEHPEIRLEPQERGGHGVPEYAVQLQVDHGQVERPLGLPDQLDGLH